MLIRVDDFPSGGISVSLPMPESLISQAYDDLLEMRAVINAPFTIGVSPCMLSDKWVDKLLKLSNLEVAVHGLTHRRGEFLARDEKRIVYLLNSFRARFSTKVFIPPFNYLNNNLLAMLHRSGFKVVCIGPETYRIPNLDFTNFKVIQSSWYGYSRDIDAMLDIEDILDPLDCMTFHLSWEKFSKFKQLKVLMERIHKAEIKLLNWSRMEGMP